MHTPSAKGVVRARVRARLQGLTPQGRAADSQRLVDHLLREPRLSGAGTIMAFAPMPDEPDLMPALGAWLGRGVRIALPRIDWTHNTIAPVLVQVLAPPELVETAFGILEPGPGAWIVERAEIDVVLVPGLAFGPDPLPPGPGGPGGFPRLGKGKGFYDRFLAGPAMRALTLGIALNEQLVHDVPMTPSDVPVMGLATPDAVRWAR